MGTVRSILEWSDPPPDARAVITPEILDGLRARPGVWALVIRRAGHRYRPIKAPQGVEQRHRYLRLADGTRWTGVWARWVG